MERFKDYPNELKNRPYVGIDFVNQKPIALNLKTDGGFNTIFNAIPDVTSADFHWEDIDIFDKKHRLIGQRRELTEATITLKLIAIPFANNNGDRVIYMSYQEEKENENKMS